MAQRREQRANRVEMFFIGRIEQQRADPRVSGNGREIAVAEVLTLNQARFVIWRAALRCGWMTNRA